jgi:hypothetical protein
MRLSRQTIRATEEMTAHDCDKTQDSPAGRTILVGVLIAVIPAVLGYWVSFAQSTRTAKLTMVNQQIEKLYGPLYALTRANDVTWEYFSKNNWSNKSRYYFDPQQPPSDYEVTNWRRWMRSVFQPLNLQMEHVIVTNSQLIVGTRMPTAFSRLIAQTESYKAVISQWTESDKNNSALYRSPGSNVVLGINYPADLSACVETTYNALKDRQSLLQGSFFGSLFLSPVGRVSQCRD